MESSKEKAGAEKLKRGYTTGSCSAAATKAALIAAVTGIFPSKVRITTPKGEILTLLIAEKSSGEDWASCAIKKYSGDDPDITNGSLIFSKVVLKSGGNKRVNIDGGKGVGRVTKPGLACAIGEAAINPVPRAMIGEAALQAMEMTGYDGDVDVIISVPEGEELAKKTFNPGLGIVGGISILGTSGIVEPMSEQALIDTIELEMRVKRREGRRAVILTPGNYGKDFLSWKTALPDEAVVKISNFVGEALKFVKENGFQYVLLSSHLGKLIKVAGGVMNTHSRYGDGRMEILSQYARTESVPKAEISKLGDCVMVDEGVRIIEEAGYKQDVMKAVVNGANFHISSILGDDVKTAVMTFSNKFGLLAVSDGFNDVIEAVQKENQ